MTRDAAESEDPSSRRRQMRMRQLQQILESAVVTGPPADRARVAFGARVLIRHLNGEEDQYRIVGVDESDPANDQISWQSPLARQLLGKAAGERFRFKFPSGEEELEIRSVEYP
jgi:transcription elongation factor GreB